MQAQEISRQDRKLKVLLPLEKPKVQVKVTWQEDALYHGLTKLLELGSLVSLRCEEFLVLKEVIKNHNWKDDLNRTFTLNFADRATMVFVIGEMRHFIESIEEVFNR